MALVVKVMKGTGEFREDSKSFLMCRNEAFIYEKVLPYLKKFIQDNKSAINTEEWTPKIYHLFYGKIPGLLLFYTFFISLQ